MINIEDIENEEIGSDDEENREYLSEHSNSIYNDIHEFLVNNSDNNYISYSLAARRFQIELIDNLNGELGNFIKQNYQPGGNEVLRLRILNSITSFGPINYKEANARFIIDIVLGSVLPNNIQLGLERYACVDDDGFSIRGPLDYTFLSVFENNASSLVQPDSFNNIIGVIEAKRSLEINNIGPYESQLFFQLYSIMKSEMEDNSDSLTVRNVWGVLSDGKIWIFYFLDQFGRFVKFFRVGNITQFDNLDRLLFVFGILFNGEPIQTFLSNPIQEIN